VHYVKIIILLLTLNTVIDTVQSEGNQTNRKRTDENDNNCRWACWDMSTTHDITRYVVAHKRRSYHSADKNKSMTFPDFSRRNCRQYVEQVHIY